MLRHRDEDVQKQLVFTVSAEDREDTHTHICESGVTEALETTMCRQRGSRTEPKRAPEGAAKGTRPLEDTNKGRSQSGDDDRCEEREWMTTSDVAKVK